jgi:hypothetical protein
MERNGKRRREYYFEGFLTNSTPFSMLPLRPLMQASRRVFSFSVTPPRMLVAFSAPLGCIEFVSAAGTTVRKQLNQLTPSSTGVEKNSTPVALAISSPPGTPGR